MSIQNSNIQIDFSNTKIAFADKSNNDLKQMILMFKLMSNDRLTNILSVLGLYALKLHLPFTKTIIRKTMYKQFCGGESLLDCQPIIDRLYQYNCLTILDYGAEAKSGEKELNNVMKETINAIEFASTNISVPVVSTKFTGLIENELLEKIQLGTALNDAEKRAYSKFKTRAENIAKAACKKGVSLFVDAEETWIQEPIDQLVEELMSKYNIEKPIIYNTYQLYLKPKLNQLKSDYKIAQEKGYILGAKLVRGAYMEKERERAEDLNYPSPIHDTKPETDESYNEGLKFVIDNYKTIASCNASHNEESNMMQAEIIFDRNLDKKHPHLNFAQLYGMSDHITYNLGNGGYNAAKYLPYGKVSEVFPYLVRRAQENKSISGDIGKELKNIVKESKRRSK